MTHISHFILSQALTKSIVKKLCLFVVLNYKHKERADKRGEKSHTFESLKADG